ncbi:mitochondrial DNA-directed RNA polymeras-like protein [Byssothecium circinans]|uniref:DNA-directed RNA polymerase n=1 Tax=Byssothecium circinans TaxID=147558 RepID=A0A6A5TE39_9PLEO|nr:mitochondrial DNA-directed RNA polymeras-like protein [Byssothecium circinans]KAF1950871.1 mitochondrial DNA-directed RNA polymeras-like protein [Byssothecium circinans]
MMLARAARRKLRRDAFRSPIQLAEQLTLPRLCHAQMRWTASTPMTANLNETRKPRSIPSLSPRLETRSLVTTADVQPSSSMAMPFDFIQPWGSSRLQPPGLAKLDPWDPSTPLILRDHVNVPTTAQRYGIGGDPTELYQNLHACLRVGRMDRATAIVERLMRVYNMHAPEVLEAHNLFLQTMFELAEQNPTPTSMEEIERWYNAHVLRNAIEPSAATFVTLLRASMTFLDGQERTDAIQKYLNMAQECSPDMVDEINNSEDFSDTEWDTLIRFQPEKFKEPPAVEMSEDIEISTPLGLAKLVEHGILPNPAHKIREVKQKGLGLHTLKDSLAVFDQTNAVPYPDEMEGTKEEKDRAYAYMRQLRLENDSTNAAIQRWKVEDQKLKDIGVHGIIKSKPVQALMWQWYSALLPLIKKDIAKCREILAKPSEDNMRDDKHVYGPFLEACSPEKVAALTVSRVIQSCAKGTQDETNPLKVSILASAIGDDVEAEANLEARVKHKAFVKKQRRLARREMLSKLSLNAGKTESTAPAAGPTDQNVSLDYDKSVAKRFPLTVKTKIGALVLELMLKSATIVVSAQDPKTGEQITNTQPAFHHHTGFIQGKKLGFVAPHSDIMTKLRTESMHSITTTKLPMVFEPKPWTSFDDGGFHNQRSAVIRTRGTDPSQRAYAHSAISNGDMTKVLAGLDVLGRVPWQINKDVFEVMAQAWNQEEAIGGMVAGSFDAERPVEPPHTATSLERGLWLKELKEWGNLKSGQHSQRCFQNFQLEIARAYLKEERIYFPHSVDFRGRAYPIPPLLNHIGADLARGILRFANGKELGVVGLQWLKVQLANLYGFDKASLREREQFAMDNLSEIYDSATNPLTGRRWWTKAEDPWQCLACCMELKNALDSADPTRYVSHLPIHQDGTCNGLQHYAALGGDHAGASQVNLEPSDRPQDIYTGVAELVREMVAEDAANGHDLANLVKDKITRKVVKRTVMTNVYGVTFMGAKLQVLQELKDVFPNFAGTDKVKSLAQPALYIALKIFTALGKIFNGAQEIQYWLGECGERITTSISAEQIRKIRERINGGATTYGPKYKKITDAASKKIAKNDETFRTSIIWTTPLKMPVVQPYRKESRQVVKTHLQEITVTKRSGTGAVDKRKQLQAFPPNFIHSLDATHMLLSALKCGEMGLDFAAVHDSFWTHAADIPNLNVILREAFVRMHSEDIMGRLAVEFKARYADSMYRATLISATPVGRKIAAWRKEHRGVLYGGTAEGKLREASFEEVALEARRQELLKSEDPKERAEGETMVTPTSIWLANQDPKALASFRLTLLGETKQKGAKKFEEVKDKVLSAEVEGSSSSDNPADPVAAAIEAEAEDLDVSEIDPETEASLVGTTGESTAAVRDATTDTEQDAKEGMERAERLSQTAKRSVPMKAVLQVWLPLTFPPVPQKGSWDVSRLRDSKYFFS